MDNLDQLRLEIVNDTHKIGAVVDAMTRFLSEVLVLKDDSMAFDMPLRLNPGSVLNRAEINRVRKDARRRQGCANKSCPPLGKLMNEELAYKTTDAQEKYLRSLAERYDHSTRTMYMCLSLLEQCGDKMGEEWEEVVSRKNCAASENVELEPYTSFPCTPFYFRCRFERHNGEIVSVGAVAALLAAEIEDATVDWMHECDRTLCETHHQVYEQFEGMDELVASFAKAIARRQAMLVQRTDMEVRQADIALTPRFLQCRAECEFSRTLVQSECQVKIDRDALIALSIIARDGGDTVESKQILLLHAEQLSHVIHSPPQELGMFGENIKRMNLAMLKRVVKHDVPFSVRCQCASSWANNHGGWAQTTIHHAINLLNAWKPGIPSGFVNVATQSGFKSSVRMPGCPGAHSTLPWYALPHGLERDGLDSQGKRIVWITSWVWQLMAHGAFEEGVVSKDILVNVALESLHQAQLLREIVDTERKKSNQGVRIRIFENSLNDPSSDIAVKLDMAMCRLSGFSALELDTVFGFAPVRNSISSILTTRTRQLVPTTVVPAKYQYFAVDALALLLPSIKMRRHAHGIHVHLPTHPIADLMRTLPKIRGWSPLHGSLRIDLSDLDDAHPQLRNVLDHHSYHGTGFVTSNPPDSKAKKEFVFDTMSLMRLMQM